MYNAQIVDEQRAPFPLRRKASTRLSSSPPMSSPVPLPAPSIADVHAVPDDADPERVPSIPPPKMGSIIYDREEFNKWPTYEQAAIGIEIRLSKTRYSQNNTLYSTCETFRCARARHIRTPQH